MAASFLNTQDIEAVLQAVGPALGYREAGELRDALVVLENLGAVRVGLTWDTITIRMPKSAGGEVVEVARQHRVLSYSNVPDVLNASGAPQVADDRATLATLGDAAPDESGKTNGP